MHACDTQHLFAAKPSATAGPTCPVLRVVPPAHPPVDRLATALPSNRVRRSVVEIQQNLPSGARSRVLRGRSCRRSGRLAPIPVTAAAFLAVPVLAPAPPARSRVLLRAAAPVLLPARVATPAAGPTVVEKAAPAPAPSGTTRFENALDSATRRNPFHVVAMWNDGERTWSALPRWTWLTLMVAADEGGRRSDLNS